MKVHASASIHQYERAVEALQEYNRTVELGFQYLMKTKPLHAQSRAADHSKAATANIRGFHVAVHRPFMPANRAGTSNQSTTCLRV